jgi:helix-turn-helix protein
MAACDSARRIRLVDGRKIPFFWIASSVVEDHLWKIGPSAFCVYAVLAKHARNSDQRAWPSQMRIADSIGCSRVTVRAAIKALIDARLISARLKGKAGREYHEYVLLEVAKNNGLTRSKNDRGKKSDRAWSEINRAGSKSVHELDGFELDGFELDEKQGIANAMSDQRILSSSDFEFCTAVLDEYGIGRSKRTAGAVRSIWAETIGNSDQRRHLFKESIETAVGMSIEHSAGVLAFAKTYVADIARESLDGRFAVKANTCGGDNGEV